MIFVRVRYFGILAGHAGKRAEDVRLPVGSTLRQLLDHLAQTNTESFRAAVFGGGVLSPLVRVIHNHQAAEGDGVSVLLADGDEILLFPVVSGGS